MNGAERRKSMRARQSLKSNVEMGRGIGRVLLGEKNFAHMAHIVALKGSISLFECM